MAVDAASDSVTDFGHGNRTAEYLGIELPDDFKIPAEGADFAQLAKKNGLSTINIKLDEIEMALMLNRPVAVSYSLPEKAHTVGIQALEQKVLPSGKIRQRFKVMDPDVGRTVYKPRNITGFKPVVFRVLK